MARGRPVLTQRTLWTVAMGLLALAFWVVAFGVGWRGWILVGPEPGIVAHVDEFGFRAYPYMIPAAILTMTTVMMGIGTALIRRIVDGPTAERETLPTREPLPEKEPLPEQEPLDDEGRPALGSPLALGEGEDTDDGSDLDSEPDATIVEVEVTEVTEVTAVQGTVGSDLVDDDADSDEDLRGTS